MEFFVYFQTRPKWYGELAGAALTVSQSYYLRAQNRRLHRLFSWVESPGYIDRNPIKLIPRPRLEEPLVPTVTRCSDSRGSSSKGGDHQERGLLRLPRSRHLPPTLGHSGSAFRARQPGSARRRPRGEGHQGSREVRTRPHHVLGEHGPRGRLGVPTTPRSDRAGPPGPSCGLAMRAGA